MSKHSWIKKFCRSERFTISPKLRWVLTADPEVLDPFDFEEKDWAIAHLDTLKKQFPTLKCVPFARRRDRDDLFVIVLQDPVYKRGQVINVDIEDINHYFLEESYPSLDAWAHEVWTQLEEWRKSAKIWHAWIEQMFRREGFELSRDLRWFLACDRVALRHYYLLDEKGGADERASIQRHIPDLDFVPFAWRKDRSLVIGVVLDDPVYQRGQVLVALRGLTAPPCIEYAYPTIDAWARDARKDITERRILSRCSRLAPLAHWILRRFSPPLPV